MSGLETIPVDSLEYNPLTRQIHKVLVQFAHVGKLRAEGDIIAEQEYLDKLLPDEAFIAQARLTSPSIPALISITPPPVPEFDPEPVERILGDFIKSSKKTHDHLLVPDRRIFRRQCENDQDSILIILTTCEIYNCFSTCYSLT